MWHWELGLQLLRGSTGVHTNGLSLLQGESDHQGHVWGISVSDIFLAGQQAVKIPSSDVSKFASSEI